jgi:RimJ/RimL family protein N-acetyltransferase
VRYADNASVAHPLWPLFDLRLRTERLELRLPTDDELIALADVARAGIHPPEEMPFAVPWTDAPSPAFERGFVQHHWAKRAEWTPAHWVLNLATFLEGRPIGSQSIEAADFPRLRTVRTGSWLGGPWQGKGYGTEMREAVLTLAFDGLGAEVAESGAFTDNAASAAVSRSLGYVPNGIDLLAPRGEARELARYRLTRAAWTSRHRRPTAIEGLEGCLELFGAASKSG